MFETLIELFGYNAHDVLYLCSMFRFYISLSSSELLVQLQLPLFLK